MYRVAIQGETPHRNLLHAICCIQTSAEYVDMAVQLDARLNADQGPRSSRQAAFNQSLGQDCTKPCATILTCVLIMQSENESLAPVCCAFRICVPQFLEVSVRAGCHVDNSGRQNNLPE